MVDPVQTAPGVEPKGKYFHVGRRYGGRPITCANGCASGRGWAGKHQNNTPKVAYYMGSQKTNCSSKFPEPNHPHSTRVSKPPALRLWSNPRCIVCIRQYFSIDGWKPAIKLIGQIYLFLGTSQWAFAGLVIFELDKRCGAIFSFNET